MSSIDPDVLLSKIRTQPHWRILAHPIEYQESLFRNLSELEEITRKNSVRLRGWDYPHVDTKGNSDQDANSFASWVSFMHHREYWRFYASGQFVHLFNMWENLPEHRKQLEANDWFTKTEKVSGYVNVTTTVFTISEVHEFLSRLAGGGIYDSECKLVVELKEIQNYALGFSEPGRHLRTLYRSCKQAINFARTYTKQELLADPKRWARESSGNIFSQFGAKFTDAVLSDLQSELYSNR